MQIKLRDKVYAISDGCHNVHGKLPKQCRNGSKKTKTRTAQNSISLDYGKSTRERLIDWLTAFPSQVIPLPSLYTVYTVYPVYRPKTQQFKFCFMLFLFCFILIHSLWISHQISFTSSSQVRNNSNKNNSNSKMVLIEHSNGAGAE